MAEVEEGTRRKRRSGLGLTFWFSVCWLVFIGMGALLADVLPIADPNNGDFLSVAVTPGTVGEQMIQGTEDFVEYTYWLGSDNLGRDVLARILKGGQTSLLIGLLAPLIGLVIGGSLGMAAGYYRGWTEAAIVAIFYTLVIGIFVYRELDLKAIFRSLETTTWLTGRILLILFTATVFGRLLVENQIPAIIADAMSGKRQPLLYQ